MRLPPIPPLPLLTPTIRLLSLSLPPTLFFSTMSPPSPPPSKPYSFPPSSFPITPYTPHPPPTNRPFPYQPSDFLRADESPDADFYATPRFVTHIDDHAIALLKRYYAEALPKKGRVLDLCSSWVSHLPREMEEGVLIGKKKKNANLGKEKKKKEKKEKENNNNNNNGDGGPAEKAEAETERAEEEEGEEEEEGLHLLGLGLNPHELSTNPLLTSTLLQDLNTHPQIPASVAPLHATVCVVSIDYLTKPLAVLSSLRERTVEGGSVHLVISNRCFPTKVVGRWLKVSERERLEMVGDYLWWSGWGEVEIVEVCDGRVREGDGGGEGGGLARLMGMFRGVDPLWVVRGVKVAHGGEMGEEGKSEL